MARLQPCPKCGAQFDVSAMAVGTAFTCGACGAVVTAGAAPAAPSRMPPAPAHAGVGASSARTSHTSSVRASSTRGPQYVPVERHREGGAAGTRHDEEAPVGRHGRSGRGDRLERGAPRKQGLSPLALGAISLGGVVLVVAIVMMVSRNNQDPKKDGGSTPVAQGGGAGAGTGDASMSGAGGTGTNGGMSATGPSSGTPGEGVAQIDADVRAHPPKTNEDIKRVFDRYKTAGAPGAAKAKEFAERIVLEVDPKFAPAQLYLGRKKFHDEKEMPDIANRAYNYIRIADDAVMQGWFDDDEAFKTAEVAWEKTIAHQKRMEEDPTFRALDTARLAIAKDPHFKDYNYEAIFASPYLVCYSSEERVTQADLAKLSYKQRLAKLSEMEKRRGEFAKILAEKGKIYQQLYREFLRRYKESCNLHELMDPYGGRIDLPPGKRSMPDGVTMIVWIFSSRAAWDEFHQKVKGEEANPGVAGYFSPQSGWVYLYDDESEGREFCVNKTVHEGTHQLEHWFQKQKRDWGQPVVPQSFFGEGFAEYIGAVTMDPERQLTFHGVNRPRIQFLQVMAQRAKSDGRKLPIFPIKDLVGFEGYGEVGRYGGEHRIPDPLSYFYAQSWAFVYFLNEFSNHKYQPKFNLFLNDMLLHPKLDQDKGGYAAEKIKLRLGIRNEEDWKKLQKEFETWYLKELIPMDLNKLGAEPPGMSNWPGYVPVDPVDPRTPSAGAPAAATKKEDSGTKEDSGMK